MMNKPYWVDEFERKHEAYSYDDPASKIVEVAHDGRTLRLIVPQYMPPFCIREVLADGRLLLLIGERSDEEDADGEIIEGGDGVLIVGRAFLDRADTYWCFVDHSLFPQTLERSGFPESRLTDPNTPPPSPTISTGGLDG